MSQDQNLPPDEYAEGNINLNLIHPLITITIPFPKPTLSDRQIEALQQLLTTHRDVLHILLQQQAHTGPLTAPATVLHIRDCRAEIVRIKAELRAGGVAVTDIVTDIVTDEERSNVAEVKTTEIAAVIAATPETTNRVDAVLSQEYDRQRSAIKQLKYEWNTLLIQYEHTTDQVARRSLEPRLSKLLNAIENLEKRINSPQRKI